MMTLEEYLRDPCGSLSIPYWKWKGLRLPGDMRILHEREFTPQPGYRDEVYFRLRHDLRNIGDSAGIAVRKVERADFAAVAGIIAQCYQGLTFGEDRLAALTRTPVYAPELWLLAEAAGRPVGCVIADLDPEAGEGILEWVQVLPQFRRRGIGRALVNEALRRMEADFATVSGRVDNATSPEKLYRACGFTGDDRWHILTKE